MRDELSYLEPLRRQLAEVLQKQAGSLPSVTLSSNLLAQAESDAQQFKAQKGHVLCVGWGVGSIDCSIEHWLPNLRQPGQIHPNMFAFA